MKNRCKNNDSNDQNLSIKYNLEMIHKLKKYLNSIEVLKNLKKLNYVEVFIKETKFNNIY